ncbi:hypothetical protein D3C87_1888690 [compost metagenome]
MPRITCFYIGFINDVKPGNEPLLVARPDLRKLAVLFVGATTKEVQVMGGWAVVRQYQKKRGVGLLD